MTEQIGNVRLDLSKYGGQDYYSDGAVEDELLRIVQEVPQEDYGKVIQERKQWPILYHLSSLRENIVEWLPIDGRDKVLEVGSGCGAITGALAAKAEEVTCVDLSYKRSLINAHRHKDCGNVTIHVGNFKDIEPGLAADYDYICLIGVFEYGQGYIGGPTPYEDFLRILLPHLAPDGRIVIAIENKYGLKYFAGCREDHLGTYFGGIEDYAAGGGVRTFGRQGLEKILDACGVKERSFYYPYPDYKFMTTLYSDKRLPAKGELSNNLRNFDRDRMLLFDEKRAFDGLAKEGLFPIFSNSYLLVLGDGLPVQYVKYSNDRARDYQIKTEIVEEGNGLAVYKTPLSGSAAGHVAGMGASYEKLRKRYQGSALSVNECRLVGNGANGKGVRARFAYVSGTPLSELMDRCLEQGDVDGFYGYFREYWKRISFGGDACVTDYDLVFSNLLVSGEDWTLIDYEWTFDRQADAKELAYRAVYCYLLENEKRKALDEGRMLQELGIREEEAQRFREREMAFQRFVTGGLRSMAQIRDDIGMRVTSPQKWVDRYEDSAGVNRFQVYEDRGDGYREEDSYFLPDAYQGENRIDVRLKVDGGVRTLRIDPAMDSCIVKLEEATWNGTPLNLRDRHLLVVNGKLFQAAAPEELPTLVFATKDPNINLRLDRLKRQEENELAVRMEIVRVPMAAAQDLAARHGLGRVMGT